MTKNATSNAIVTQIAERENRYLTDLPPLYDVLDPESLDALLNSDGVTVTFSYCGYEVTVTSDDTITITDEQTGDRDA
jgi:hypothetical protein